MIDEGAYYDRIERFSNVIVQMMRTWDGPRIQRVIDQALIVPAPAGVNPEHAVIMMLAAQVPADVPSEQRLGWTQELAGGAA